MTKIRYQIGALAVLAVALGISTPIEVARADDPKSAESANAGETEAKDWSEHLGDIPFIVGRAAGDAEAQFTGKPPMYFFTTTW